MTSGDRPTPPSGEREDIVGMRRASTARDAAAVGGSSARDPVGESSSIAANEAFWSRVQSTLDEREDPLSLADVRAELERHPALLVEFQRVRAALGVVERAAASPESPSTHVLTASTSTVALEASASTVTLPASVVTHAVTASRPARVRRRASAGLAALSAAVVAAVCLAWFRPGLDRDAPAVGEAQVGRVLRLRTEVVLEEATRRVVTRSDGVHRERYVESLEIVHEGPRPTTGVVRTIANRATHQSTDRFHAPWENP